MQSAGGLVTTPQDFANWLLVMLNDGKLQGRQVIDPAVIQRVQRQYVGLDRDFFKFHRQGYGLGLYHSDYEGDLLMHHFGGFSGYMAHASFMPEHDIGVVAFTNEIDYGGLLPHLTAAYIYDLLLGKAGLEDKYQQLLEEWKSDHLKDQQRAAERLQSKKELLEKAGGNKIPDPGALTGTYYNPRIGPLEVIDGGNGKLLATYGIHTAPLLLHEKDQYIADWQIMGLLSQPVTLTATYSREGQVTALLYGNREYRKLAPGTRVEALNGVHQAFRVMLQKAAGLPQQKAEQLIRLAVAEHYPSGALTEPYLNLLGYHFLNRGQHPIALTLFEEVIRLYPRSANAYDSLAEAYLRLGNEEKAKLNYKKSLELNPDNERARKVLEGGE